MDGLSTQATLLWTAIVILAVALAAIAAWIAKTSTRAVLTVERLEIVEPNGSFAIVLANSERPTVGTIDGEVIMEGQEEERRESPRSPFSTARGMRSAVLRSASRKPPMATKQSATSRWMPTIRIRP